MRYSYEFKRKCVELYRKGKWPDTPKGVSKDSSHRIINQWIRIEDSLGPEALRHKSHNKVWTPDEKLELISQVLSGKSYKEVALTNGISDGMLYQWVRKYKTLGYNGLVDMKKGRPSKLRYSRRKSNNHQRTSRKRLSAKISLESNENG